MMHKVQEKYRKTPERTGLYNIPRTCISAGEEAAHGDPPPSRHQWHSTACSIPGNVNAAEPAAPSRPGTSLEGTSSIPRPDLFYTPRYLSGGYVFFPGHAG